MAGKVDLHARRQRAAQMILESDSVTSALEEDAAEVVLNWALAEAEAYALSSEDLGDEDADRYIAQGVGKVRGMMSLVNDLVEEYDYLSPTDMVQRLTHLLSVAMEGQKKS